MASLADRSLSLRPSLGATIARAGGPVLVALALAFLMQFGLRPIASDYWDKVVLDALTNIVLAVSLTMVNGFTGQFSIGHAAFMAVGAYTAACITYYASFRIFGDASVHGGLVSTMVDGRSVPLLASGDLLFLLALLAGGVIAGACGYLVGLPSLRLRGDYLAIVTLGFGEIVRVIIQQTTDTLYDPAQIADTPAWKFPVYVGGGLGFTGLPFYTSLFWTGLAASLTILVAFRLKTSSAGRAFLSIREDEIAAEAMGVHTTRYKIRAFVISAAFAGAAGGLFAHTNGVQLNPGELGFMKSFDIIIMVVLGGLGSISGAAIAACVLTILPELLRDPPGLNAPAIAIAVVVAGVAAIFSARRLRPALVIGLVLAGWEAMRWSARAADVSLADYRMVIYAVALVSIMIVRPQGLLGIGEIWQLRPARPGKGARWSI